MMIDNDLRERRKNGTARGHKLSIETKDKMKLGQQKRRERERAATLLITP